MMIYIHLSDRSSEKSFRTVCGSLREAMQSLDKDRKFLTEGGVFTDDQIDAYIELKFQEIYKFEHTRSSN
jgi:glutamine synthetase